MEPLSPKLKKLKSPVQDAGINVKNCVTCTNVPEGLFDPSSAKKHFSKFGKVVRIRMFPKRQMNMVEYDQVTSAERAVLNAGAYDGFMFDVTRAKPRVRRRSVKKEDDPDWVPDSDVEEELSAMSGAPSYRVTRQKPMDVDNMKATATMKLSKQVPIRKKVPVRETQPVLSQTVTFEVPVSVTTTQTSFSTSEAAAELVQLKSRVSLTPDEQWRTLDARDRILRAWGGAGARVKVGGATIGTCQDMCPEKERLHRQAEHQVMTLETVPESDGLLEPWRAVKQYSRSSADQEMPMCYELRPAPSLMMTCRYLLHEIADTTRQVTLADWFHFLWDRFRGIRKDITQQALCCSESIRLVEMCARFHAHCSARLADLEHTQFDQKLNTDNLTKCLQTLKHMYGDVDTAQRPREAEFRGYIALLNMGDSNFWWEIKQLPEEIQKSEPITFAIKIFNALDNNNYVRFFRLVRENATYLQACILLRYFNDVRARALARIVKAFAPRGGSRYPAEELRSSLAFESEETMKSFIHHYGLRFGRVEDGESTVILDRNEFIEDSDPYPLARERHLIESKRQWSVGEVIAGGPLPPKDYQNHRLQSSFNKDGTIKEGHLIGEDLGYNTLNDTNKDLQSLKAEVQRLSKGGSYISSKLVEPRSNLFVKPEPRTLSPKAPSKMYSSPQSDSVKLFSFKPAITVAPTEIIEKSPEKLFDKNKNVFSFSKPQESESSQVWENKDSLNIFKTQAKPAVFGAKQLSESTNLFGKINSDNKDSFKMQNKDQVQSSQNLFKGTSSDETNIFKKTDVGKSIFAVNNAEKESKAVFGLPKKPAENLFSNISNTNIFVNKNTSKDETKVSNTVFVNANFFAKPEITAKFENSGNIFAKPSSAKEQKQETKDPKSVFGTFGSELSERSNFLAQATKDSDNASSISPFAGNGEVINNAVTPGSLFKSVIKSQNGSDPMGYKIFQSKNKSEHGSVAANIFNSVISPAAADIYNFNKQNEEIRKSEAEEKTKEEVKRQEELKIEQERRQEELRKEHEKQLELKRQEEIKKMEEVRRKQEELKRQEQIRKLQELEEKRKKEEERRQEELRKILEEEKRQAEIQRKIEEDRKFKERCDYESSELIEELINEVNTETVVAQVKEEIKVFNELISFAKVFCDEILTELCDEICEAEIKAENLWTKKLMKKWFAIWRSHLLRNLKRRRLLDDTPVWIAEQSPLEKATILRRLVENSALKNMNAVNKGYRFSGELKLPPISEPYNIMEIIKSPLLKRMKQISYQYDGCLFWKITLVSPGVAKWLYRKVEIEKWLLDSFSDKQDHETSDSLIHVGKQSWNNLMDFAISVSLTNIENKIKFNEALEGTNALLFYTTEYETNLIETIDTLLKQKYAYQIVPIAVVMPTMNEESFIKKLESYLKYLFSTNTISAYKIFFVDRNTVYESLNISTKSAMKWLAKKYPPTPPLEVDYLKSLCQRYLGNEIWCRLKYEKETILKDVLNDLSKLVKIYNLAVDKLTGVITNEDLFNYPSFPLEFQKYLNRSLPYPKSSEFIPSNVKTSDNVSAIKDIMKQLQLPELKMDQSVSVVSLQENIRTYCKQIGWVNNAEEVVCKVISVLPNEFSDVTSTCDQFNRFLEVHDLLDILNIIVYEKINSLNNFENRFAMYEKEALKEFCNGNWCYETEVVSSNKHKALDYVDDIDFVIDAKRRKIAQESFEYLMLEENDCTLVEENIKANNEKIHKYNNCKEAVKQLEEKLEEEKRKSVELENLLRAALSDI